MPIVSRDDISNDAQGLWILKESRSLFTGIAAKHHQNGELSGMMTIRKVVLEGAYVTYYENGQLAVHGMMKGDRKIGLWYYFYSSGILHKIRMYEGDRHLYEKRYDKSGKLEIIKDY